MQRCLQKWCTFDAHAWRHLLYAPRSDTDRARHADHGGLEVPRWAGAPATCWSSA